MAKDPHGVRRWICWLDSWDSRGPPSLWVSNQAQSNIICAILDSPNTDYGVRQLKVRPVLILLALTVATLFVHGYHPWAEDAEIYLPGVEKLLNPALFPFNTRFFESHAHLTLFPNLIAASARWSHLRFEGVLFCWQILSIFLFLLACWSLSGRCFKSTNARWAAVALVASLFTIPVAGTALYLMDQYINPRTLVAFAEVLAIVAVLDKKYFRAALFLAIAALFHPLMSVFVAAYCLLLATMDAMDARSAAFALLSPLGLFDRPSTAYHQVALLHYQHYPLQWHWYEWLGGLAPIAILWAYSRLARARGMRNLGLLCRALVIYELICSPAALMVSVPERLESLARLQPMRSLYLVYVLFFLITGGLLGEFVLKNRVWRWLALFVPLCAGMFIAQRVLFPASAHIEWPGVESKNPWVEAFEWIRVNTPINALFALNPEHMHIAGEDENGFRAVAERSMLADSVKDSGAVTMFPQNAEEWLRQVTAEQGWENFQAADFERLQVEFGVNWVVLQAPVRVGLNCPYSNRVVSVCRVE